MIKYKRDMILRLTRRARKRKVTHLYEIDEVIRLPAAKGFKYTHLLRGRRLYWDSRDRAYVGFSGSQKPLTVNGKGDVLTYDKLEVVATTRREAARKRMRQSD